MTTLRRTDVGIAAFQVWDGKGNHGFTLPTPVCRLWIDSLDESHTMHNSIPLGTRALISAHVYNYLFINIISYKYSYIIDFLAARCECNHVVLLIRRQIIQSISATDLQGKNISVLLFIWFDFQLQTNDFIVISLWTYDNKVLEVNFESKPWQ